MLKLVNISKRYGKKIVLNNFSYTFPNSGMISIVGPSGCGKTTLLNIISTIDSDYKGNIYLKDKSITSLNEEEKERLRLKTIGYVFQNFNLINLDTVFNNVSLPFETANISSTFSKQRRVEDLLSFVGLKDKINEKISVLSGGEKQRVAIARALVNDAQILLCDEPSGALDEKTSFDLFFLLKKISLKSLVIVVTHDENIASKYSDTIIKMLDGEIHEIIDLDNKIKEQNIPIYESKIIEKRPKVPFSFKLRHFISTFKHKKVRSIITNLMTSLGLVGVGLSILLSTTLSKEIKEAFSSVINDRQIVCEMKTSSANSFGNILSASLEETYSLKTLYPQYVQDIGVNYLINFETFFKNQNDVFVSSTDYRINLNHFSSRTFNDFEWLTDDIKVYPKQPEVMENDQIIIGLPYDTMANLCFSLYVLRNYESLGEYIDLNNLQISLGVENIGWGYDDVETFRVVGVVQSTKPKIYHTNHMWNEWLFQEKMRLPVSSNKDNATYPWIMNKTYYFVSNNEEELLNKLFYDERFNDYVFEPSSYSYYPSLCPISGKCEVKRIMVFICDKYSILPSDISHMKNLEPRLKSYSFATDYGYSMYSSSLAYGFTNNFYLSSKEEYIDNIIDSDTKINGEEGEIQLPPNCSVGSYLKSSVGGLVYSSLDDEILTGTKAKNVDEICVSSALYEKLGRPSINSRIYSSMQVGETLFDAGKEKLYAKSLIKLVGVMKNDNDVIYGSTDWTISFFRDKFGISSFYLLPRYVVFDIEDANESDSIIENLNKRFRNYEFSNPVIEIGKTIDDTLSYVKLMLLAFSSISLVISLMLFSIVIYLNVTENKEEIRLMRYLGINKKDIKSMFTLYGFFNGLLAFISASIELIVVDIFCNKILSKLFTKIITFNFSITPILIIFGITILISVPISYLISNFMVRNK